MNIDAAFPSTYLKAADLQKRTIEVTIHRVVIEEISGGEHKPIMYFHGKEKGLVLNKTNANTIAYLFGTETDAWTGRKIELFPTMVEFQGRPVEAIRVRPVAEQQSAAPAKAPLPQPQSEVAKSVGLDDEIPF